VLNLQGVLPMRASALLDVADQPPAQLSGTRDNALMHVRVSGKFLTVGGERHLIRGVSYGTFAPDQDGVQFPRVDRIAQDFALMAAAGINTVRIYTPPPIHLLDEAARHGLRVMIGLPWSQHIAFLNDRDLARRIRRETTQCARLDRIQPHCSLPSATRFLRRWSDGTAHRASRSSCATFTRMRRLHRLTAC
jgi:hypothetical protein